MSYYEPIVTVVEPKNGRVEMQCEPCRGKECSTQ